MQKRYTISLIKNGQVTQTYTINLATGLLKPTDLLRHLYPLYNMIIQNTIQDKPVTCSKGCSVCCNQLVPVTLPEVYNLRDLVHTMPSKKQKDIKNRFYAIIDTLKQQGLHEKLQAPRQHPGIDEEYFNLALPCPFLENNTCGIYPDRPFECRKYTVTSPPELCKTPYSSAIQPVTVRHNIGSLLAVFSSRLYTIDKTPVPLILALEKEKQFREKKKQQWDGHWMLETILQFLTKMNSEEMSISYKTG